MRLASVAAAEARIDRRAPILPTPVHAPGRADSTPGNGPPASARARRPGTRGLAWNACGHYTFALHDDLRGQRIPCIERLRDTPPMTATPALAFEGVTKSFGRHRALDGFSLDVRPGELFGLVGANGAGKTTLIKCLLDFATPDSGAIRIFGIDHRETRARAPLAFLPERFVPPHYLTGRDFLAYMLTLHGRRYDETAARSRLEALDLAAAALDRPVRSYSKGMTQKLGLAACLLSEKPLYVLDEPTSGLDPRARALLKGELKRLREAGRTLFLTSHLLADIEELCGRLAIVHAGRLRFSGTPAELLTRYAATSVEQAFLACTAADEATAA